MREDEKNLVQNPFQVGDRVETIDTFGRPLKSGIYKGHSYTTKGALRINYLRDDGVMTYAHYPRGIRKKTVAITLWQPPMDLKPKAPQVIHLPDKVEKLRVLPSVAEKAIA